MKTKVLKALASLPFSVVASAMGYYKLGTINQLVDKMGRLYNVEDIEQMKADLTFLANQ